ncbi:unnamed protein product [Cuscuta europaea]|uniref:TPX2 C-terminal domain-containing protein n=1 Tax=Cuscuta europaea TaxID=41803 RepID=A0A9P0Z2F5_CUSEU|nr:unnamed protein product [Cuscuta europaea]
MESNSKSSGVSSHCPRITENVDPNISSSSSKLANAPSIAKSAKKSSKSASKTPNPMVSPSSQKKIRQRKFVVAKRNTTKDVTDSAKTEPVVCKCGKGGGKKCSCVAYASLRASHEEFFKSRRGINGEESVLEELEMRIENEIGSKDVEVNSNKDEEENGGKVKSDDFSSSNLELNEGKMSGEMCVKRRRAKVLGDAMENGTQPAYGNVMHLVKAFEELFTIHKPDETEKKHENGGEEIEKGMKLELSDCTISSESLGLLHSHRSLSLDSSQGRTLVGGINTRSNSAESSGVSARRFVKRRLPRATSQNPFNLRTEQRGKSKEKEFINKLKQMEEEDKKYRIPIAQGLPWTTDEPECLVKPPVKESTRTIDLVLHSDMRAADRAEFDHKVEEKLRIIEQQKMERDRLQKLAEEEEIRRLRKELVPKAQPLPYFDRPFIPVRSEKLPTLPREPKFHIPQTKKIKSSAMKVNNV